MEGVITTYNQYVHDITLIRYLTKEDYRIKRETGLRNEKKITREEFEILCEVLFKGFVGTHLVKDPEEQNITRQVYKYQVTKGGVQYRYLETHYKKILEDVYQGRITYWLNENNKILYSDNDGLKNLEITANIADKILTKVVRTTQDLIIEYVGESRDPAKAIETSNTIFDLIQKEKEYIFEQEFGNKNTNRSLESEVKDIDLNEYINLDPEETNKMQTIPRTPEAESDDQTDDKQDN